MPIISVDNKVEDADDNNKLARGNTLSRDDKSAIRMQRRHRPRVCTYINIYIHLYIHMYAYE